MPMGSHNWGRRELLKTTGATGIGMVAGCRFDSASAKPPTQATRVAADPTDVPDPVDWNSPRTHEISMETREIRAPLKPDTTFYYMTFDGQIPGPMIRVRRGDRIRFELTNPAESNLPHNIDFHAVYGPGGGADDTTILPGESAQIEFKAMYPGLFIYHCAIPNFDHHISSGMFGAILVEPKRGLPEVDRELYFGQHEIYTADDPAQDGHLPFDFTSMAAEEPTYVVFNGEPYAFTEDRYGPIQVNTGERIRLYFVNGGPNLTSSWHAIGNVWSRLYRDGDMVSKPARFIETTSVAPGTATVAEMKTPVPGPVRLVDHAVTRAIKRGALGVLTVNGKQRPNIYSGDGPREPDFGNLPQDFDGWMDDVDNYTGVLDKTDVEQPMVVVGAEGNGGAFAFEPAAIKVSQGATVVWEWTGKGGYHNVVDQGDAFESELLQQAGAEFKHTFNRTGVFKYSCTPHESLGMKGVIVVE